MTADAEPTADAGGRGATIGRGATWLATWSLRLVLVAAGAYVLWAVLGRLWTIVLPVLLALLLTSVLWPVVRLLRRGHVPPALAALLALLGLLVAVGGILALITPRVTGQAGAIASQASGGLEQLQSWITGPPLNLSDSQVNAVVDTITSRLQSSAASIAAGLVAELAALGSLLITAALSVVLTFFFLKDGPRFLPWLHGVVGRGAGGHLEVVLGRAWGTLSHFILGQVAVGLVDAVLIGIALVLLDVPLALALAVLTFFGGFIPILGATVAGALAVLVALVAHGFTTALITLAVILAVQQIEGNVLQPLVQGRSLALHPAVILLSVTAGGALYGVAGAFLAVPVAAVAAVVLRYLGEVVDDRQADAQGSAVVEPGPVEQPADA